MDKIPKGNLDENNKVFIPSSRLWYKIFTSDKGDAKRDVTNLNKAIDSVWC